MARPPQRRPVVGNGIVLTGMSAFGTSRTFRDVPSMSAIVGNSDIKRAAPKVRD
jgi:hypothetical protein